VLEHFAAVGRQSRGVGASDRLEHHSSDENQRSRRAEESLRSVQKDPGTEVISIPLSVHPQSALLHATGVEGGLVISPSTSVSNTHPPASAPDELPPDELLEDPLDELPPDELLEDPLDELPLAEPLDDPPEELLEDPLEELLPEELPEAPLDESRPPSSVELGGVLLLLLPHAVAQTPTIAAARIALHGANALRTEDFMCRSHSHPGWAS
jgi:hypothetical protein